MKMGEFCYDANMYLDYVLRKDDTDTHWAATWLLHPNAPHVEMPDIVKERIARMSKVGGDSNG